MDSSSVAASTAMVEHTEATADADGDGEGEETNRTGNFEECGGVVRFEGPSGVRGQGALLARYGEPASTAAR